MGTAVLVASGATSEATRRGAGILLVFAWAFWLHRWVPALLVAGFVVWVLLHHRLEAAPGEAILRRWRRVWPPGPVVSSALLSATLVAFALSGAPATAKILPVGLGILALSMTAFGAWWRLVTLPRRLGGPGSRWSFVGTSGAIGVVGGRGSSHDR